MKASEHVVWLLVLQCWTLLAMGGDIKYISFERLASVGTVAFKGSTLRVFDVEESQVAEPRISFRDTCDSLRFNNLALKFQLTIPIGVDANTLEISVDSSKKVGQVTLTELKVKPDEALISSDAKLTIVARLTKPGEAQLIFLCDTFYRCQQLMDDINSNPEELRNAITFTPIGQVGSSYVKFGAIRSATPPKFNCVVGRWVVFQRRVDGSLSFAQNWDTYVNGFGNPDSNYWMGLKQLFAMTVTSTRNGNPLTSRCQLRVDTEDWAGRKYWGEYNIFTVLGPDQNYRLRAGLQASGSQPAMESHNEMQFSTYDKDNDSLGAHSCSQMYGFGGWWYGNCHTINLNGAYTTDRTIDNNPTYSTVYTGGKHVPMKSTLMKFKCN